MAGSGSPCGACKFLRRKCASGCVFAPFFYHEEGSIEFSAIHRVFGASNVSKLLARPPLSERHEAARTISYEAQARVQDPIYGCVSYISALQQQVLTLQAQIAFFRQEAAAQQIPTNGGRHNWLQPEYPNMVMSQFGDSSIHIGGDSTLFGADTGDALIGRNGRYNGSSPSMASVIDNTNDLNLIAFGYNRS